MNQHEAFDEEQYRQAIGPLLQNYYLNRFRRFAAGGSQASWNWPAFFVSFYWMLYRKMWAYAGAYLLLNGVFLIAAGVLLNSLPGIGGGLLVWLLQLVLVFVVVPMFANALYFRAVTQRIREAAASESDRATRLEQLGRKGGTSIGAMAGALVFGLFVVPFFAGLLAVAIPAYQDYSIRVQVSEGPALAADLRAEVAETIEATGIVPSSDLGAGFAGPATVSGQFVRSVIVDDGRVVIAYGNEAHAAIAGRALVLTPYLAGDNVTNYGVVWRCGYAPAPEDAMQVTGYASGTVAGHYLPMRCR